MNQAAPALARDTRRNRREEEDIRVLILEAALFDLVVFGPFNDLLARFSQPAPGAETLAVSTRAFVSELLS